MARESRRGNRTNEATGSLPVADGIIEQVVDAVVDAVVDSVEALDTALEMAGSTADAPETRQEPNPGPRSSTLAPDTFQKISAAQAAKQIQQQRETEWVNVAEALGDPQGKRYRVKSGEPWKLLMVVDMTPYEWGKFQGFAGQYESSVEYANQFILLHNGWTRPDGSAIPQPGDLTTLNDPVISYVPATRQSDKQPGDEQDIIVEPIMDDGEPLFRQVISTPSQVVAAAFWQNIPGKLVSWCMSTAWARSCTLPNLTSNLSSITSGQPTRNGKS